MATLLAGIGQGITGTAAAGATGIGGMIGSLIGSSIGGDLQKDTMGLGNQAIGGLFPGQGQANNPAQTGVPSNPSGTSASGPQGVTNLYSQGFYHPMTQGSAPSFGSVLSHLFG